MLCCAKHATGFNAFNPENNSVFYFNITNE